jgi:hypothetical protein
MGRPRIIKSPAEFDALAQKYFDRCKADGEPALLTGLAFALGFESKQSLYDYSKKKQFSYSVKKALLKVEMEYEKGLHGQTPAGCIFALKNFDWTDKTTVDNTSSDNSRSPAKTIDLGQRTTDELMAMCRILREGRE